MLDHRLRMENKMNHRLYVTLFAYLVTVSSVLADEQQEAERAQIAARSKELLGIAATAAGEYRFKRANGDEFQFHEKRVLHWYNPARGQFEGALYVWTLKGRPEVIVSIHRGQRDKGPVAHEFHSLSTQPFIAIRNEKEVWHPKEAGVVFQAFDEAVVPGKKAQIRLIQMRALARRFQAGGAGNSLGASTKLRLLPQPLYRYESTDDDILDGGVFAFTVATDPELLLLIEARRSGDGYRWEWSFARMDMVGLNVMYKGRKVWSVPHIRWTATLDRDKAFTLFDKQ